MTTLTDFAHYLINSPFGRALLGACNVLFTVLIAGQVAVWVFGEITMLSVVLTVLAVCLAQELLYVAADRVLARFTPGACADVDVCPRGCCVAVTRVDGKTQA